MSGWPDQRFVQLAGPEHPIIQAPMAGAGGVELCVAAFGGGAVGSLPCGMLSPDQVREQVAAVREQVAGPINLNFFCHTMPAAGDDRAWRALLQPFYDEFGVAGDAGPDALRLPFDEAMCAVVEELRPAVVSFHFGLPDAPLMTRVKAAGAIVLGCATSVAEARWLEQRGVDAVIAQGFEAGGHAGRFLGGGPAEALSLFALVPQVADAVAVPVIAAGGIADGRGIAAAFDLGASAVQLGTAFLHAPEARISDAHRSRLGDGGTVFTNLMTGGLARGLRGRLIDSLGPVRTEAPPYPLAAAALAPIRAAAEKRGEYGFGPMWAGQSAPLGRALPAAELVRTLAAEALAIIGRRA
ncbi:nitronate monooxygenase [Sphingomonas sp.]|uniref:NAD(P)H-dependent flavin oxidoreductase n=1 Tax=Sphingomonas sp. TaxID=28214 RepID=UPI00286D9E87|nr:nitronate monooxygenase [Sphingomonas sp.]